MRKLSRNILVTAGFCAAMSVSMVGSSAFADDMVSASPEGAIAYIVSPKAGQEVTSPVTVVFGLKGMGVTAAGLAKENTGHHHLLIDNPELTDMTAPLPASDQVKHFGGGQTEVDLALEPGEHTLQLLLANHFHVPHNPPVMSEKVTITVK